MASRNTKQHPPTEGTPDLAALVAEAVRAELKALGVQPGEKAVVANRFIVVDAMGTKRGEFGIDDGGQPEIRMWDNDGALRIQLQHDGVGGSPYINLYSAGDPGDLTAIGISETGFVVCGPKGETVWKSPGY